MKELLQLRLKRLDIFAFFANNDTGAGAENGDLGVLGRPLNDDTTYRGMRKLLHEELANLDVFLQHPRERLAIRIPLRRPIP